MRHIDSLIDDGGEITLGPVECAATASPHSGSGMPTTAASSTSGCESNACSTSAG